jgi:hypothetical protein
MVSNSALLFWKLLASFVLGTSEILHCSVSAPLVKIVPLLDVHQLLMLSAATLTYLGPGTFSSVVFYNILLLLLYYYIIIYIIYILLYYHYSDVINCLLFYFVCVVCFFHSCSLCNWPLGCWVITQINENWFIIINYKFFTELLLIYSYHTDCLVSS